MEKDNPFKVPDNYFQNFNRDIILKIKSAETKNSTRRQSLLPYIKWLSSAAVVVGVALVGYYSFQKNNEINGVTNITANVSNNQQLINTDKQLASIQSDYYSFIEDETMQQMYKDYIDFENL